MPDLTPAQERVVALVAAGHSVRDVAAALWVAEATARTHIKHVQARLDLHTLQALTAWWWQRHTAQVTAAARAVTDMPYEYGLPELARRVRTLRETLDRG